MARELLLVHLPLDADDPADLAGARAHRVAVQSGPGRVLRHGAAAAVRRSRRRARGSGGPPSAPHSDADSQPGRRGCDGQLAAVRVGAVLARIPRRSRQRTRMGLRHALETVHGARPYRQGESDERDGPGLDGNAREQNGRPGSGRRIHRRRRRDRRILRHHCPLLALDRLPRAPEAPRPDVAGGLCEHRQKSGRRLRIRPNRPHHPGYGNYHGVDELVDVSPTSRWSR